MKRVLIGEVGAIVRLGLRQLIAGDGSCEVVAEQLGPADLMDRLVDSRPDVVLLDLDDEEGSGRLVSTITADFPAVKVIACSATEPTMRVFPPFHHGESYESRLSPESLLEAVKQS